MIKNKKTLGKLSLTMAAVFLFQMLFPTGALALTGGPSQPEVESFEPIGTNQMVDPFTGDFTYNIPLMDIGGYPINISYHSGVTMDQEASWVGLGWNINPGVINRNMRGLPDDFKSDEVISEFNLKDNETYTLNANVGLEIFGMENLGGGKFRDDPNTPLNVSVNFGLGVNYNTYEGVGVDMTAGIGASLDLQKGGKDYGTAGLGLDFVSSSNDGLSINPSLSYGKRMGNKLNRLGLAGLNGSVGASFNSRQGMKAYSVNLGHTVSANANSFNGGRLNRFDIEENIGTSSTMSLTPATYVPSQTFPFESGNYGVSFKIGGEIFGLSGTFDLAGTYSYQKLRTNKMSTKAYGYYYSEHGIDDKYSMLDFNREKERAFTRHTPNLPLTNFTYDLFGISGQGIGGMFRAHRSDVGYVRDPYVQNTSSSFNTGGEVAFGQTVKWGGDVKVNSVKSESGMWVAKNDATNMKFTARQADDIREASYFKLVGEKNTNSTDVAGTETDWWKSQVKGDKALKVTLKGNKYDVYADNEFTDKDGNASTISSIVRSDRAKREQLVSTLTMEELDDPIYYAGKSHVTNLNTISSGMVKPHHIGQVKVVKADGSRYVYGVPAYNYFTKDATFNVSGRGGKDCQTGLIWYGDNDASTKNDRGKDNFYQSTKTPAYAHSFLLSEVLSADYADYDDEPGPSEGDIGNYVKFEYKTIDNYKWRVPYQDHHAAFNEGLKSLASDDLANFSYGEKELKYLEKVISKTHVAIFHTSDRDDAKGVKGIHGGYDATLSASMQKLDKISLYNKVDYDENGVNAVPLQEVHFEYDYSLCPGIVNSATSQGKLTLKRVYFTYGNSFKAKMNAYDFNYADLNHNGLDDDNANPSYNLKGYDRWGSYKPNQGGCDIDEGLTAFEFPYTPQDKALVDVYKAAWSLTSIELPSGGKIEIDYESDDYAYVQDKRAMQMFKVIGTGVANNALNLEQPWNVLYTGIDAKTPIEYLFVETADADSDDTNDSLKAKYFDGIIGDYMYFRFLMNLSNKPFTDHHDYVSGYCKVLDAGFVTNVGNGKEYAWIKIDKVKTGDPQNTNANANPISVATWNFARMHNTDLAYSVAPKNNRTNPSEVKIEDIFVEMLNSFKNFGDFIAGPNGALRVRRFGQKFIPDKSWVRLTNPTHKKLGGGSRVSKLVLKDNWDLMTTSGNGAEYGQEYFYTLGDDANSASSGVASYEPLVGGEENPFRQPVFFSENRLLAPDDEHYMEKPFGESFFPGPSVGYSRVVVRNLQHAGVTKHATGHTVHEFYTSKDFPTKVDQTGLQVKHKPASFLGQMLKFSVKDFMQTSQGYVVETNDMHGKPKAKWIYAEGEKSYQSGVEYLYQTNGTELSNTVDVLLKDNEIEQLEVGVDYDLVNDFRHSKTESYSGGLAYNGDVFMIGVIPFAIPMIIPSYNKNINRYRSASTTKVVNRFAIQTGTKAYYNKSVIETKNLLWDAETGEVLLTESQNQFDDPVYNFKYPAHFAYEGMAGAYINEGYEMDEVSLTYKAPFVTENSSKYQYFHEGDEVLLTFPGVLDVNGDPTRINAWVIAGTDGDPPVDGYYLIGKEGNPIPGGGDPGNFDYTHRDFDGKSADLKIIRSGRRNMVANVGAIALKSNPISTNGNQKTFDLGKTQGDVAGVLTASAVEYKDRWHAPKVPEVQDFTPVTVDRVTCEVDQTKVNDIQPIITSLLNGLASSGLLNGTNSTVNESTLQTILGGGATGAANIEKLEDLYSEQLDDGSMGDHGDPIYLSLAFDVTSHYNTITIRPYKAPFQNNNTNIPLGIVLNINNPILNLSVTPITGFTNLNYSLSDPSYDNTIHPYNTGLYVSGEILPAPIHSQGSPWPPELAGSFSSLRMPFETYNCSVTQEVASGPGNPFVIGVRGNWRPYRSWTSLSDRNYQDPIVNLRRDGTIGAFTAFWLENDGEDWENYPNNWKLASTVSRYDQFGNEIENEDALMNASAALFGFSGSLPIAVGQNVEHGHLTYEGFEDLLYPKPDLGANIHGYFEIYDLDLSTMSCEAGTISNDQSHTGKYSLKIAPSANFLRLYETDEANFSRIKEGCSDDPTPYLYVTSACELSNNFFQSSDGSEDKRFLMSYWLKEDHVTTNTDLLAVQLVNFDDIPSPVSVSVESTNKSNIIEGWQKVEQLVKISGATQGPYKFKIEVKNSGTNHFFFDDLRIHPLSSSMKSFVYDPFTMRQVADLDGNNYATFYEYDEEGILVRVKKETERGILTISEFRNHLAKQ